MTVTMKALTGVNEFVGQSGTEYVPDVNGLIYVQPGDVNGFIGSGSAFPAITLTNFYSPSAAPAAAAAAGVVTSAALSDGNLTIAAQPDVPRPLAFIVGAGSAAITGGELTLTYVGNDSQNHTEIVNLVLPSSGSLTHTTSFGVVSLSTPVVSGLVGGSSPFVYGGTDAALALPISPNASGVSVFSEKVTGTAETVGSVNAQTGVITPTTAPNATHTYSFGYNQVVGQ